MRYQFQKDWGCYPNPDWFDHEYDLAFFDRWKKAHFFERGVYLQEVLHQNWRVLDLCCGDGSIAALFLSPKVKQVVSVDIDPQAIRHARRTYGSAANVAYHHSDIRIFDMGQNGFDMVSYDAAIEYFTKEEAHALFTRIKAALKSGGLLAGSTTARQERMQHHEHKYVFHGVGELESFLKNFFQNVAVWDRVHEDRTYLYFRCSDTAHDLRGRKLA